MTCRGHDSKTVKISKTIKRAASRIVDPHERGAYIRMYVEIEKTQARGSRRDSAKNE